MKYQVKLSPNALSALYTIVTHYESEHDGEPKRIGLQPKMCPAGYWTEGYGQVVTDVNGKMIKGAANKDLAYKHSKIKTHEQALEYLDKALYARQVWLEKILQKYEIVVSDMQKASLISLIYNIGYGAFLNSSLFIQLRLGFKTKDERINIDKYFRAFKYGGGKILPGLVKRRTCESYLFLIEHLKLI